MNPRIELSGRAARAVLACACLVVGHAVPVLTIAFASGCEPPPAKAAAGQEPNLAGAVEWIAKDLRAQLGPGQRAGRTAVIDPLIDGRTGQQTKATAHAEELAAEALAEVLTLVPFEGNSAGRARFVLNGTVTHGDQPDLHRLTLALSDRKSGIVVAQSVSPFREAKLDVTPTRFYADSPSLTRDRSVEGYIRTANTEKGKPADALYIDQVPTSALLAQALAAYDAEKWQDALALYGQAAARPDGQQLRTFNGVYLSNLKLNRAREAEDAFAKIADLGISTDNLAVKLLFRPGHTDFWPDPGITQVYPMWLRQIGRAALASETCLEVVGHTSPTGSEAMNLVLSRDRATAIRTQMMQADAALESKLTVSGVGSKEVLIGTGADDASDALDRRVEFKVIACAK